MDKYIGFDIDSKKTVARVVQEGQRDRYTTFKTDIPLGGYLCPARPPTTSILSWLAMSLRGFYCFGD